MAQHLIFTIQLATNEYAPTYALFTNGRWIKVYYDDVTETVRVYLSEAEDPTATAVGEALSGPYIPGTPKVKFPHGAPRNPPSYSYCDASTLVTYTMNADIESRSTFFGPYDFPYVLRTTKENHWSCEVHSCDIDFDLLATDVTEDSGAGDGSVTISASTNAGPPKYTVNPNGAYESVDSFLPDDYPGDPEATEYTFENLATGTYTIYALDTFNCRTQLTIIIPTAQANYGVKWRLIVDDVKQIARTTVDIEERDYEGAITEVKGGSDPIVRNWTGESVEDIFTPLIAYKLDLTLLSQTDFQFLELFTQDDRKYRVRCYRDDVLNFEGFIPPSLYSEPYYIEYNYHVSITATDQIGTLKGFPFGDDFDNLIRQQISFLDGIRMILRKTGVNLNIFEAVNIYPVGIDGTPINFLNPSFETGSLTPWVNIPTDQTGFSFQWFDGNVANSDPSSGSWGGAPALSQVRPNSVENWQAGDYTIDVTGYQTGATLGMGIWLYGFDDEAGNGREIFGIINTMADGDPSDTYTGTATVTVPKKYLGVGFVRNGPDGLHEVTIEDINVTASPGDTQASSPLQQCFFDPTIYINDNGEAQNCEEVLKKLLVSFGARLYQARGMWIVESIEQKSGTIDYRIFNMDGELQSNGQLYDDIDIEKPDALDRLAYRDRTALLSILQSYGKFTFTIPLSIDNNLLLSEFDTSDVIETEDGGNPEIIGWTYDMTNGDGIGFGIETVSDKKTEESRSVLFVDFSNTDSYKEITFISQEFNLSAVSESNLLLTFDVYFRPLFQDVYSYIDYSVKIGDLYVLPANLPDDNTQLLIDGEYIRVYVDDDLQWNEIRKEIKSRQRSFNVTLEGPVTVKFRVSNNALYDYASITALRAQVTDENEIEGGNLTRVKVLDDDVIRFYRIVYSDEADNYPVVIRPDDYSLILWKLDKTLPVPEDAEYWLNGVLLDNVKLSFDLEFPETISYTKTVDENIKLDLERDIIHADLALYPEDIDTPADLGMNYQRIMKNWIRFSDGSPTSLWFRSYSEERRSLIDILMRMQIGQMSSPSFKFSGTFDCTVNPSLFNIYNEVRLEKKLIAISMSVHDADNYVDAELSELKTGSDGLPPADIYEFTEEFTTEFNA